MNAIKDHGTVVVPMLSVMLFYVMLMLGVFMLSVFMLSVSIECCYFKCRGARAGSRNLLLERGRNMVTADLLENQKKKGLTRK